ncbi:MULTISPECIES: NTP transferase domain-containing protein [unclassified Psychrobacter]|uniref:NTP transferase domain-containing protein n=1 Tax=unclassified Psychrobacter TaxID=196806 RepID=UPI000EC4B1D0|nr:MULTISPECIES: NTP transferase domain-containing protein [unclassified Psychrobacter]MBE8608968.1 NTP transferase domain-containing protein [Pseudomonas lundensis]HCI77195.1 nucleotidyltransferase family protein [Psychrobacter sp.]
MSSDASILASTQLKPINLSKPPNHVVIILASGLSLRLGQAKQLLCKDGEPLICFMTKLALSTKPQAIIIVIPDNQPLIASAMNELAFQYSRIQMVVNSTPEIGMAYSLNLAIEAVTQLTSSLIERVVIMGVDQVLLDEQHLAKLLADKRSVVASSYSSWQYSNNMNLNETSAVTALKQNIIGLPLTIDYDLLREWQALLVGDKGLRYLIRGLPPSQRSTVVNHQLSYDIDTPEQLAHAKQKGWLDK